MLKNNVRNNITEVSKTSQFGLSQSIRGLAVVGIAALVFVVWGISPVDYLTIYPERQRRIDFISPRETGGYFLPQTFDYTVQSEVGKFLTVPTPQDKIIDQLESDIERLKLEIFELKGDNKLLKMQLKECATKLQEQQGYYDDDGNYVE